MIRETNVPHQMLSQIANRPDAKIHVSEHLAEEWKDKFSGLDAKGVVELLTGDEAKKKGIHLIRVQDDNSLPTFRVSSKEAKAKEAESKAWDRVASLFLIMEQNLPGIKSTTGAARKQLEQAGCKGCKAGGIIKRTITSYLKECVISDVDPNVASFEGKVDAQDFQYLKTYSLVDNSARVPRAPHVSDLVPRGESKRERLPASFGGPRPSCADCFRKHIGKAIVLLEEAELGYPQHFWLAMANLSEAEAESLTEWPDLSNLVREVRLEMTEDRSYRPNLMQFFDQIDELTQEIEKQ